MKNAFLVLVALSLGLLLSRAQEAYRLDSTASRIEIHLDTAGALGVVGHPHLIQTPIEQGSFIFYPSDPGKSAVDLVVDAGALQVIDPKVSAKDRTEIQTTMQSDRVLGINQHPKIHFKSVRIEPLDHDRLQIIGNLTLRNQTHPVTVQAMLDKTGPQLKVTGQSQFKQSAFGIEPVSAGLGTVRVKDQINISFQVFGLKSK